jgi:predicted ATPase/DNA-binding SARP family transcriptional activator
MESSPASLAISLLGHARVTWNGAPHKFSAPPRTLPLLGTLLLNRGTYLMRDHVAFTLWPDDTEDAARTNLRRHLSYLKAALPTGAVPWFLADAESVTWNEAAPLRFDVDVFRSLVASPATMADAVECYAGDLLAGYYDDWLIVARDRLRAQFLGALDTLLVEARAQRKFALASEYAHRLLGEDPWREDALRHLMAARYEAGDRTGALHEFDTFARRLHDDGAVELMAETLVLRDAVLRGAALPESSRLHGEDGSIDSGAASFPFVGRSAQLAQMTTAWTRAARGRGSLLLVGGEAGTGKSRIASELALIAGAQGARVLRGATPAPEQRPYHAIASALRSAAPMLTTLDMRPVWLHALGALLPEIDSLRADAAPLPALDAEREQARLFEALSRTFHAIATVRPTLLILEDLHWAGRSTLAAIEYLARRAGLHALLIVGTYRSEEQGARAELGAMRRRLAADELLTSVALGGLAHEHVAELVAQIPALAADVQAEARRIFELSGGNALFVCELLRDQIESPHAPNAGLTTIRAAIEGRVGRLSADARLVADAASVVGATFDVDVLGEIVALDGAQVGSGVSELLDRRLIREVGPGHYGFAFSHHLVQMTLYDGLDTRRRSRWHARIAAMLETLPRDQRDDRAASLARHYEASDQPVAAAAAYAEAARGALAVFANDEAIAFATRALALDADAATRFELLLVREAANARRGDRTAQRADVTELLDIAAASGNPALEYAAALREVRVARADGDTEREQQLADALMRIAQKTEIPADAAQALAERASAAHNAHQADAAEAAAGEALAAFRAIGDEAGVFECACLLAEIASTRGSVHEMRRLVTELRAAAPHTVNKALIARSTMAASVALMMQREYESAQELAFRALELYREIGDREGEAAAGGRYATLLAVAGRLDQSRREHESAARIYRDLGKELVLGNLLFNLSVTELLLGRLDVTMELLADAERIFERLGEERSRTYCWVNFSTVLQLRGDGEAACDFAQRALAAARVTGNEVIEATALANLGNAERSCGRFVEAIAHMTEALAQGERMNHPAAVEELANLALAYFESGDLEAAEAAARRTLDRARVTGDNEAWRQYGLWISARVLRAVGHERDAADALERAHRHLCGVLDRIEDPAARTTFLALAMNVEILAAVEHGVWPS